MKKLILTVILGCTSILAPAYTLDVQTAYTGSSKFEKAHVSATAALNLNIQAGLEATFANEHHNFKNPVYSAAVPVLFDFDLLKLHVRPFYYFKNKSDVPGYQSSGAFGVQNTLILTLNEDTTNDIYTHASIGASFARQQGTVFFKQEPDANRYYNQVAYTFSLEQAMYRSFDFRLTGTAFQYPDGISKVAGLRSVMDQRELADTQTLDIVHQLARYTVGLRAARLWAENDSAFYIAYRFGDFYTSDSEHSVMVGNSFPVTKQVRADMAYNHVRDVHNHNRRDIWQLRIEVFL